MFEQPMTADSETKPSSEKIFDKIIQGLKLKEMSTSEMREHVFCAVVLDRLVENFERDMEDLEYSDEEIRIFKKFISELDEENLKTILSVPYEIRKNILKNFREKIDNEEKSLTEILSFLLSYFSKQGYTIGYHASKYDIPKRIDHGKEEWNVRGTELDDRDDMHMAYYSLDYEHVFRKRHPKFIYVVRAETKDGATHKRDQSNNWGRAASLSIVDRFDIREIDAIVDQIISQNEEK